jgi:hypothetical protein
MTEHPMSQRDPENDDPIDRALAALPTHDVEPRARERTRREAHGTLRRERALAAQPVRRSLRRVYRRTLEPVLLAAGSAAYVAWAVREVLSVLGA